MAWEKRVPVGPKGESGLTAYQIAVNGGFVGTEAEWLLSLGGAKGEPGIDGTGSGTVSSVNDIEPDANGNVALPLPPEPNLTDYAKKNELSTLAQRQAWSAKPNLVDSETSESATTAASNRLVKRAYDRAQAAFQQAVDAKAGLSSAITAKGVSATTNDSFAILASKIGLISTGRRFANGQGLANSFTSYVISGLGFQPKIIVAFANTGSWFVYSSEALLDTVMLLGGSTVQTPNYSINSGGANIAGNFVTGIPYKWIAIG